MDQKLSRRGGVEGRGVVSYRENYMCAIGGRFRRVFLSVANFEAFF
tara:strand:+ start:43 stop:180 length:138 start_codon:yes stop_codon:yes gene_type:complete